MSHMYVTIIEALGRQTSKRNAGLFHCSPCLEVVCDDAVVEKLVPVKQLCSPLPLAVRCVEGRVVTTGHHQIVDRSEKQKRLHS